MPYPEFTGRKQFAVYWALNSYDDYGRPLLASPIQIRVRWEAVERDGLDPQGTPIKIEAGVVVDRAVTVDGIMWQGKLADLPSPVTDLKQIIAYHEIPDVKGRKFRRTVDLMKYGDTLPDLA